jgi:hypothetical protein
MFHNNKCFELEWKDDIINKDNLEICVILVNNNIIGFHMCVCVCVRVCVCGNVET